MAWAGFIVGDASSPGITEDMGLPALNARRTHRSATHPPPPLGQPQPLQGMGQCQGGCTSALGSPPSEQADGHRFLESETHVQISVMRLIHPMTLAKALRPL